MAKVKVKLNSGTARRILRDPSITDLEQRARRIAARADSNLGAPGHEVRMHVGINRARAVVVTVSNEAKAAEGSRRNLSFALQAGR